MVEHQIVDLAVAGSSPVAHPKNKYSGIAPEYFVSGDGTRIKRRGRDAGNFPMV